MAGSRKQAGAISYGRVLQRNKEKKGRSEKGKEEKGGDEMRGAVGPPRQHLPRASGNSTPSLPGEWRARAAQPSSAEEGEGEGEREREGSTVGKMDSWRMGEEDFKSCSGSARFAREMAAAGPFPDLQHAITAARDIWFNKVDVKGWLESFAAHPEIGATSVPLSKWSKEEQSTAVSTAADSTLQELLEWNSRYKEKFGCIFIICASGRGMPEILAELKKRYSNRPIVELELAAQEEMKIIEIRLSKLFTSKIGSTSTTMVQSHAEHTSKAGDRLGVIGGHLTAIPKAYANITENTVGTSPRSRPPITTHILDVSRGCPASGVEVHLEMWKGTKKYPSFKGHDCGEWALQGSSVTDSDGRSGPLMNIVDYITPGIYRISFNTGKYVPLGFFPYVSVVFEIKESQRSEHFHVPLLLSPFSFSTYRGS